MVVVASDLRLRGLRRRDARAEVDGLYRRHADEVLRYALLLMRSQADAEDVVQATFIRALRAIAHGERVYKPRNWLIKIAHNECRRTWSARSRRAEVELGDVAAEATESGRAEDLRRALHQLAPKQREALVLRELEGRSYAEIATSLGISDSAVETLIFRARRAVREQLESSLVCDEAVLLIGAGVITDDDRTRLRAHTRSCSDCATLERQARGRKGALGRLASAFGLPWFGKVAAVALTVSAAATTTAVIVERLPARGPAPVRIERPAVSRTAVQPLLAGSATPNAASSQVHRVRHHGKPTFVRPAVKHAVKSSAQSTSASAAPAGGGTPTAAPGATPAGTPTPTPTSTPTSGGGHSSPPAAAGSTPPPTPAAVRPATVPPAAAPVTDAVNGVVAPVTDTVNAVATPVVETVDNVLVPVAGALAPVTDPVTQAAAPVTTPVNNLLNGVTAPLPVAPPPTPPVLGISLGHK